MDREEDRIKQGQIEKEIRNLRKTLTEKHKNKGIKIREIEFYKEFPILPGSNQFMPFEEQNIFIVAKEEKINGTRIKSYEIRGKDQSLIANVMEDDRIVFSQEYLEKMQERLKELYKKIGMGERKVFLHKMQKDEKELNSFIVAEGMDKKQWEKRIGEKEELNFEIQAKENQKGKQIDNGLIESDLGLEEGSISFVSKIKDPNFYQRVPAAREYDDRISFVLTKNSKFPMMIGQKNGKYQKVDIFRDSRDTMETTRCIGKDGEKIGQENIFGLMTVKENNEYAYGFTYGAQGVPELHEYRWEDGEYIFGAPVETRTTYARGKEVDQIMDHRKNTDLSDEKQSYEQLEEDACVHNIVLDIEQIKKEIIDRLDRGEIKEGNLKQIIDEELVPYLSGEDKERTSKKLLEQIQQEREEEEYGPWSSASNRTERTYDNL